MSILLTCRKFSRYAAALHTSQPRPLNLNFHPIRPPCITLMVQTRRATQLAAQGEPKPEAKQGEHPTRPRKRAKDAYQPGEHTPQASTTRTEPNKQSSTDIGGPLKRVRRSRGEAGPAPTLTEFPGRVDSPWKVGAHVSAAGGVENTVVNAARVRANAFALFVKSQRRWSSPPLTIENVTRFQARMKEFGYEPRHVLPHGSYLINLANPDDEKREKSYACFLDDLQRCERLGLIYYNFHPGSTVGNATKDESISLIAQCLNRAHKDIPSVMTIVENMSGAKNIIGSQFTELRDIVEQVEDKSRVGVCLDTCHLYAAGYDISTKGGWDATLATFDKQVGLSYLRGMHLNDSKTPLGSKKDRHENIGLGTLGISAFLNILSDPRIQDIPLILETPTFEAVEVWEREIKVLNKLSELEARSSSEEESTSREEILNGMVGDIQSVVREYSDHKGNVGKSTSRGRKKSGRRKSTNDEEENDATESEDARSCPE